MSRSAIQDGDPVWLAEVKSSKVLLLAAMLTTALAIWLASIGLMATIISVADAPRLPTGEAARMEPGLPRDWTYPDERQTASHIAFHTLTDAGTYVLAGVFLLALAWGPVRHGRALALVILGLGGLPAAALPLWALQLYGGWHEEFLLTPVLWLLSLAASGAGILAKKRAGSRGRGALAAGSDPV